MSPMRPRRAHLVTPRSAEIGLGAAARGVSGIARRFKLAVFDGGLVAFGRRNGATERPIRAEMARLPHLSHLLQPPFTCVGALMGSPVRQLLQDVISELRGIRAEMHMMRAEHQHAKTDHALITPSELAATLGVDARTLRRMRAAHELPAPVEVRGRPRWKRREIEAFLARMRNRT